MNKSGVTLPSQSFYKVLNDDQVKIIDNAGYEILREVGVFLEDDELLKMAQKMCGEVDFEKKIVKGFQEHVIRENVAKAPRNFVLGARDPDWDMIFQGAGRRQFWGLSCGATDRLEWDSTKRTYSRRRANVKDVTYASKMVDGIDDYDTNCYVYDLGEEGQLGLPSELIRMDAMLKATTKFAGHLCTTVSDIKEHDYVAQLGTTVAGGEEEFRKHPLFWSVYNYLGTLQLNRFNSWSFRASIKHHFPIMPAVTAAAPLVGPATVAGNTAISHAGCLFMSAMKQFYDPGTAEVINNTVFALDPYNGYGYGGSNHMHLGMISMNQIWHELYGLPTTSYAASQAADPDQMALNLGFALGRENIYGTDMIWMQTAATAMDPVMIIVDAEVARMNKHFMSELHQAIPTKENLALELTKKIGAKGEGWMTEDFNLARIDTFYTSPYRDMGSFDSWLHEGSKSWIDDHCRGLLKEYEKHEPIPMPKDIAEKMNAIVNEGTALLKRK